MKQWNKKIPMMKECCECKENKYSADFLPDNNKFGKSSIMEICWDCFKDYVDWSDTNQVYDVMRWLNIPMVLDEWTNLYDTLGDDAMASYVKLFGKEKYEITDWTAVDLRWKRAVANGDALSDVAAIVAERVKELKLKWGPSLEIEDYIALETFYQNMASTNDLSTEDKRDRVRKAARLSLLLDKALMSGDTDTIKKLNDSYTKFMKECDFESSRIIDVSSVQSMAELGVLLEGRGYKFNFYNWQPQDKVDETIQNIQDHNRALVLGEPNLTEMLEDKLREAKMGTEQLAVSLGYADMPTSLDSDFDASDEDKVMEVIDDDLEGST
jgi:hypothetical protein